jgi:hypothetical protein
VAQRGETGARGTAIVAGLFKARIFILGIALALAALSLILIFQTNHTDIAGLLRVTAFPILVWACGAYALLLSGRLALIAVIVPLTAWLWWMTIIGVGGLWTGSYELFIASSLCVVAASALLAIVQLQIFAIEVARGSDANGAVRTALSRGALPGILTMLALSAAIAAIVYPDFRIAPAIGVGFALMVVVVFLLPALAASILPLNEAFISRVNRARERRERLVSIFAIFTIPRWAFATAGITAVLFTIMFFNASFATVWELAMKPYAIAFAGIGMLGAIGMRNWRGFFSCGVPAFVASIFGAWAIMPFGLTPHDAAELSLLLGSAAGAGFIYFLGLPMAAYLRAGDPMMIAFSRALNDWGAAVFILGCVLALVLLGAAMTNDISPALAILPLFQIAGALILFPAIAAALDDLFPRRRSLEELYRAR